ncbi:MULTISPECIES: hypothetical protein [unclassified Ruegeria]|uniref:hypothetical protein n=1 Tax=unclassified Ruegeria TaxID=2625375 RepID=UPI001488D11A|nr:MULTISPECIES: hypothetical protein [unclassified Ruegeria]
MFRLLALVLAISLLPHLSFAECSDAKLTAADEELLGAIAKKEKAASSVQNILAWAPVVNVLTAGGSLEAFFSASTHDFESQANAIVSMNKIKACSISTDLELYLFDFSGDDPEQCRQRFFERLNEMYSKSC